MEFNAALWPEIFVLIMACVTLMAGVFSPVHKRGAISYVLAQVSLVGAFILTLHYAMISFSSNEFQFSHLVVVFQLFILALSFLAFLYARHYVHEHRLAELEYHVLGLFSVLGMMVMVSGNSLLSLYLGLELLSLPLYAMVALQKNVPRTSEAAMKYFVMGALASGMLLYGLSLVYGATNHLELNNLLLTLHPSALLSVGLVFLVSGLIFKFGAVPFHMWVPDVYEGAPAPVTGFIASAPKIAVLGMTYNILVLGFPQTFVAQWQPLLMVVVIASMAFGNILAIAQTNLKRLLAYSSIAQLGYMLLGFLTATKTGYSMSLFYGISYGGMVVAAFAMLALFSRAGYQIETLEDLSGLNARNPWLAFLVLLLMFSMAGVPPTIGFFAKVGVLEALVSVHLAWLAALALVFALVGAFYYLRVVKFMYFDKPIKDGEPLAKIPLDANIGLGINCLAVLVLGLIPSGLIDLCRWAFGL